MATNQPRLLTDVRFVQLSLDEATGDGKIKVKGEFAKCDIATENKRIYPEGVWNKEIGRLGRALGERRVFGEMDHPSDGRTSLNRVRPLLITRVSPTKHLWMIAAAFTASKISSMESPTGST